MKKRTCIGFILAGLLVVMGCSHKQEVQLEQNQEITSAKEEPEATYINEEEYTGDELEIVRLLNKLVTAYMDNDQETYHSLLLADDLHGLKSRMDSPRVIIGFYELEFIGTESGGMTVSVKEISRVSRSYLLRIEEYNVFYHFKREDKEWKLAFTTDWI
ncbi:hypothetical protein [Paenibacillus paeoniae]|uniref:Nuclear transport factor 2 family protein n=1 Tax=Paenibacillus paeoniae TaxID=2292705 RepID=A0A371PNK3_9BACL|nr:hypothetical protein [Paenibacillus paeoniae]REK77723.1 hypothetical protein DX130_12240 [Paenibacillus paeoniae]